MFVEYGSWAWTASAQVVFHDVYVGSMSETKQRSDLRSFFGGGRGSCISSTPVSTYGVESAMGGTVITGGETSLESVSVYATPAPSLFNTPLATNSEKTAEKQKMAPLFNVTKTVNPIDEEPNAAKIVNHAPRDPKCNVDGVVGVIDSREKNGSGLGTVSGRQVVHRPVLYKLHPF